MSSSDVATLRKQKASNPCRFSVVCPHCSVCLQKSLLAFMTDLNEHVLLIKKNRGGHRRLPLPKLSGAHYTQFNLVVLIINYNGGPGIRVCYCLPITPWRSDESKQTRPIQTENWGCYLVLSKKAT